MTSQGGLYTQLPYLSVGHDAEVKQKLIQQKHFINSPFDPETGNLSYNGEVLPIFGITNTSTPTVINTTATLTSAQLMSQTLFCDVTAGSITLSCPTATVLTQMIQNKFGNYVSPGFSFDLTICSFATTNGTNTVTLDLTTNDATSGHLVSYTIYNATKNRVVTGNYAKSTFTFVYYGNATTSGGSLADETWAIY